MLPTCVVRMWWVLVFMPYPFAIVLKSSVVGGPGPLAAPDEDVQTSGDHSAPGPLGGKRLDPATPLLVGDGSGCAGLLGRALGESRVEPVRVGVEREEAARPDIVE